jgi:hypothetical protein
MIDNSEINKILTILEEMEDEQKAAHLLSVFNRKTKKLGELVLNKEQNLDHTEWKKMCDNAKVEVDNIISEILSS